MPKKKLYNCLGLTMSRCFDFQSDISSAVQDIPNFLRHS